MSVQFIFFSVYLKTFLLLAVCRLWKLFLEISPPLLPLAFLFFGSSCFLSFHRVFYFVLQLSSSSFPSQFPLQPSVNHLGNVFRRAQYMRGNEPRWMCPKRHCRKWEWRQKSDEREGESRKWDRREDGRMQVSYEHADLPPCCQNKINPAAAAPLAGSDCQSISCPINMSKQTN